MDDVVEKRITTRYTCSGSAKIDKPGSHTGQLGRVRDLSLGGCLLDLQKANDFKHGSPIELTIQSRGTTFRVRGTVTKRSDKTMIGIAFCTMTSRSQLELKELIETLSGDAVPQAG